MASKYVSNPHTINGLKYDLRVYILVTSFNPLKVYIYNDGLVRFATEKYTMDPRLMNQKFVHLTNFSINKRNTKFVKNNDSANKKDTHGKDIADDGSNNSDNEGIGDADSSKWDFKMLKAAYDKMGANYN